jgi:hemerythrin
MESKNSKKWDNSYSVGISLIDEQHTKLFSMLDTLYAGCFQEDQESAQKFFERTIRDTVDYIKCHFSTEEKLLNFIQYPKHGEHKRDHSEFLSQILPPIRSPEMEKNFCFQPYVHYLREWLFTHITVSDQEYGLYLRLMKKRACQRNEAVRNEAARSEARQNETVRSEAMRNEAMRNEDVCLEAAEV